MTFPLMVLAAFSFLGGFLNVPHWLAPLFPVAEHEALRPMIISASFGIAGILLATLIYVVHPSLSDSLKSAADPVLKLLVNKYYVDELYSADQS